MHLSARQHGSWQAGVACGSWLFSTQLGRSPPSPVLFSYGGNAGRQLFECCGWDLPAFIHRRCIFHHRHQVMRAPLRACPCIQTHWLHSDALHSGDRHASAAGHAA